VSSVVSLEEYNKNKFKNDGFTCEYCHKQIKGPYHLEHIIPVFKKGSGKLENLAIACPSCNCRKGVKDLSEFAPNKTSYFKNRKL
jgi:5-methylcytosine-specific restriction endonuclease McrA